MNLKGGISPDNSAAMPFVGGAWNVGYGNSGSARPNVTFQKITSAATYTKGAALASLLTQAD